jgi:uncharacterized membrane protein
MLILVIGLVLFLGGHSIAIASRPMRDRAAARLGEGPWKGLYSLVALAGLVLIVWGYGLARPDATFLYEPPIWIRHTVALLMLPAMIALAVSVLPAGRLKAILKHPMLLSVKIWAFAHLIGNGDLASVLLFGGFLAWGVFERISLKRRNAPIARPGPVLWDLVAVVAGTILYLLFVWRLHALLFGISPVG